MLGSIRTVGSERNAVDRDFRNGLDALESGAMEECLAIAGIIFIGVDRCNEVRASTASCSKQHLGAGMDLIGECHRADLDGDLQQFALRLWSTGEENHLLLGWILQHHSLENPEVVDSMQIQTRMTVYSGGGAPLQ